MAVKLFMGLICFFPVTLILYGVTYFDGRQRGNILFGVTLWEGSEQGECGREIERLKKKYKRELMYINLAMLTAFALCCIPHRQSIFMSMLFMVLLALMVVYFVPFARMNKKLKELKYSAIGEQSGQDTAEKGETRAVDVLAAARREPAHFTVSGTLGMICGMLPMLLELITGANDDMRGANLFILASIGGAGILFYAALFCFARLRTQVISRDSAVNIQAARVRRYQWSRAFAVSIWLNAAFTFYIWLRMRDINTGTAEVIAASLIYTAVLAAVMLYAQLKTAKEENRYAAEKGIGSDDDSCWLWGMVYYNKNDRHFMVNKRVGIGTTVNMATFGGKLFMSFVGAVLAVSFIGVSIWLIMLDFSPVKLELSGNRIISEHIGEEYDISVRMVTDAELLDELPDMSKRVGTAMDTIYKGSFVERSSERQKCEVCVRTGDGPYIRLETDTGVYYLNDEKPENTIKVYEAVRKSLTDASE